MGRKRGEPTAVVRIPLRHKQQILDYVSHLKQTETTPQTEPPEQPKTLQTEPAEQPEQPEQPEQDKTPVALGLVQEMGLIDLHSVAKNYGISCVDTQGRFLDKERLRAEVVRFFMGYVDRA